MNNNLRHGFTTGSAATAASKAAAYMLLGGNKKNSIEIITPSGKKYNAEIIDIQSGDDYVMASVIKDAGDDPDVTGGAKITSKVSIIDKTDNESRVIITGGKGVGIITRPGLDRSVGEYAINSTPREMIISELSEVLDFFESDYSLKVEISVEDGEKIAEKTFNERLGIIGGISIIGTSGIVEPMSQKALLDTIYIELKQRQKMGHLTACITPGNYGRDFMKREYDFDIDNCVKCSNYIGDTVDMVCDLSFESMLLCGHIGKLIKVSGGIMNTHSSEADCRMELLASAMIRAGICDKDLLRDVLTSLSTDEALMLIDKKYSLKPVMEEVLNKILFYLNKRADKRVSIECVIYSNEFGILAKSKGANELIAKTR